MPVIGPRTVLDLAIPTGIDGAEVFRLQMQEGMTMQEVLSMAATVIGDANQEVQDRYGGLFSFTTRLFARYSQGESSRSMTPESSEFKDPDGVRAGNIGHMLPIKTYKDATHWSADWLKKAIREDLRDDIRLIRNRWVNRADYDILLRMFSNAENQIGTAGWDAPWAIGSGVNLNYIPPQYMMYQFDGTHSHFIRVNAAISATNAASTLDTAAKELSHHGHSGRKAALVSENDIDIYLAMDSKRFAVFKPAEFQAVAGGSNALMTVTGELKGIPGEVFGYFASKSGVIELRSHARIPTGYGFMTKPYGVNDPRNGLAIREGSDGFGLKLDPQVNRSISPKLDYILFPAEHGVGVSDRTNGVAFQIASGAATYSPPSIAS